MKKKIALLICVLLLCTVTVAAEATTPKDDSWCPDCGIWQWIKKIVRTLANHENRLDSLERADPSVTVVETGGGSGFSHNTLSEYMIGHDQLFNEYETYDEYLKEACVTPEQLEMQMRYWDEEACKYVPHYIHKERCIWQHRADRTGVTQFDGLGNEYTPR